MRDADPFVGSLLFVGIGGTILGLLGSAIYKLAKYMRDH